MMLLPVAVAMTSCFGIKATKHTYTGPAQGAELGGAEVRVAFRPEGTRPGAMVGSAMIIGGGFATFDGPFRWRVEAIGQAGLHESLSVHRIRTHTLKSKRDGWYPEDWLGERIEFRPVKDQPGVVRARYEIPGKLEVKPEDDGAMDVWVEVSIKRSDGNHRRLLKFRFDPDHKNASEMIFLPTEIVEGLTTDLKDAEDPMWE